MKDLFYLDDIEIDEPQGFESLEVSIKRDDKSHGIVFEASTSPLEFYKDAWAYLKNKWETEGIKANVTFQALSTCGEYDYQEVLSGRLNFAKRKESCGSECKISIPWEQDSCEIVFKSRLDQKVDMDKAKGVDDFTGLNDYAALGVETELPAKELQSAVEGYVVDEGDLIDLAIFPRNNTQDFAI